MSVRAAFQASEVSWFPYLAVTLLASALCLWSQREVDSWSQKWYAGKDWKKLPACMAALVNRGIHKAFAFS